MCHEKRALMVNDPGNDSRFRGIQITEGIRNFLCVPLMVGAELIGVLSAYNKIDGDFNADDQRILAIIATQSRPGAGKSPPGRGGKGGQPHAGGHAAGRTHPGRPFAQGRRRTSSGYDVAGASVAAGHVGGDYYDFIPLKDNRWAFALGDVSGKGVPAALLMANLQATLRSQVLQDTSCHQCVSNCNRLMYLSTTHDRFATLFYGRLDTRSNVLTYCNAGHERPFHLTSGGDYTPPDRRRPGRGHPGRIRLPGRHRHPAAGRHDGDLLRRGDRHDQCPGRSLRGKASGKYPLRPTGNLPAQELVDLILAEVQKHAGGEPAFDDVTLVVIKKDR